MNPQDPRSADHSVTDPRPAPGTTSRRRVLGGSLALGLTGTLGATLTGCGGGDSGRDEGGATDIGELTVATSSQTLDFAADTGGNGGINKNEVLVNLHGYLLANPTQASTTDDSGKALEQDLFDFEGFLAESYEVSPDGLVYTFHLREGVLSHAGNPLTADDVLWSYERKWATSTSTAKNVSRPAITDPATQFAKVDDRTFTVTLERSGYGFTLLSLFCNSTSQIYDSVLLKANATTDDPYAVKWSAENANHGFGPYMLDSVTADEQTVLVKNPNYTITSPAVTKITYRIVQDPATRANALLRGDVQIAEQLRPVDQRDVAANSGVSVFTVDGNELSIMPLVTSHAPFDDVLVRQALAWAVPYDEIISDVYLDRAQRRYGLLPEDQPGFDPEGITEYTYDPAKAKELLTQAGHPDGVTFTLTLAAGSPDIDDTAVRIQSAAADAGFDVQIQSLPAAAFAEGRTNGSFDAYIQRDWANVMSPPYELLVWTSPGSTINWAKWENADYYAAVEAGNAAGDALSEEAGVHWNTAEQIMAEQVPWVFIAGIQPSTGFAAAIGGYVWRSDNILSFRYLTAADDAS
jgi:peptide/nickel transport system substrate-binding protein